MGSAVSWRAKGGNGLRLVEKRTMRPDRKDLGPALWLLLAGFLGLFSLAVAAGELRGMGWLDSKRQPVLELRVDPRPVYEVRRLANGRRLRLILIDTPHATGLRVPGGRGIVKSVSLKSQRDGSTVLDFRLREPGWIEVVPSAEGYQVSVGAGAAGTGTPAATRAPGAESDAASGNGGALTAISFSRIAGDRVQFKLQFEGSPPQPVVFRTGDPPRIALDFFGVRNATGRRFLEVNTAQVDSVVAVADAEKLRLVINLLAPADHELVRQPDGYTLTVGRLGSGAPVAAAPVTAGPAAVPAGPGIRNIDFRRTPRGAGRVIVALSDPEVSADVFEEGGEIVAVFPGVDLPAKLERRMDVVDFATPVNTIDAYRDGRNTRIVITPGGRYKYTSIQTGDRLMIDVIPLSRAEVEAEKKDEFGYTGERLSLNFQKISVRAALQVIADFTGLNFVTSDAITGDLTLRLQDVPWDQALDVILQTKGLAMRRKGNVVWVAPAEEIAAKEKQALEARQDVSELEPLVTELIPLSYARAAEVAKMLKNIRTIESGLNRNYLGNVTFSEQKTEENTLLSERGSVTVDERTNSLLIQDTPTKVRQIKELILKLDIPVRQVQIAARIVEATDDFSRVLGTRLGFTQVTRVDTGSGLADVYQSGTLENTNLIRTGGETEIGRPPGSGTGGGDIVENGALSVNLPAGGIQGDPAGSYAFTIAKIGAGVISLLDLELSALQAEGKGKLLANPKVLTNDKQEAHIEQGQERVFRTLTGGGVNLGDNFLTKKAVLSLTVTPQITPDGKIILDVAITNDTFADAELGLLNLKRVRTQTLLENGETVVIGGIYQQRIAETVSKVPLLGDIPVLGYLFKKKRKLDQRSELLIFLTPRIVDNAVSVR